MYPKITLSLVFTLIAASLSSQTPASATLSANRVKAQFNANGALFTDFQKGQFIAPYAPGQPEISLINAAGLWIAGLDPAGNLHGAVQLHNSNGNSDFISGVLHENGQPFPGNRVTGIYRVTRAEIIAHINDLNDNGVIDNPQPGVFGWPGRGNPYFAAYNNGEELPYTPTGYAGFYDYDGTGDYNPASGDFPAVEIRGKPLGSFPTEMLWFSFHDVTTHTESFMHPLNIEVQCQVFAYDCTDESPLRNTVFVRYKLINRADEWKEDVYFGLFNDFGIGNPNDDFFGCDPARSLVFAYNGDTNDEGGYGATSPALGVKMFRGPLDTFGQALSLAHVMPFDPDKTTIPSDYYKVLRGQLPDGAPVPNNGLYYPGDPNDPNADSEVNAGNTPGRRNVVSSYGPMNLLPGAINELIAGYFYTQESGNTALQNVQAMYARADAIQAFFDNSFSLSDQITCGAAVSAPILRAPAAELKIFPNPASQSLTIESERTGITCVQLSDLTGRVAYSQNLAGTALRVNISVAELPAGVYLAEIWLENGARPWEKVVVSR